jgi:hypothetical protein
MNIIKAKVDWNHGFSNEPDLRILIDKEPNYKNFRYNENNGHYFAELDGFCDFFYYTKPGEGFGGREFELTMHDGSIRVLKGPWSSRAGVMNRKFRPCVEVAWTDSEVAWTKGYTFVHGALTLEMAQVAAKLAGCYLVKIDENPVKQHNIDGGLSLEQMAVFCAKAGDLRWVPSCDPNVVMKPTLTTVV